MKMPFEKEPHLKMKTPFEKEPHFENENIIHDFDLNFS
jgi:hypothetical protein